MMHSHYYFFTVAFLIYSLINLYVFFRSKKALPQSKAIRAIFYIVYLFLFSAFIIAMLGRNSLPLSIQKFLYFPGTVWMGIVLYLLLYFILTDIIHFFNRFFHYLPSALNVHFRKIQVVSGYILVICLVVYGYYRFSHPIIAEQNIHIAKKAGDYKHLKIVGISDLHLGVGIDKKRLEQYVRLINAQHPDLIFITGDLVDNNALPLEKERMQETLNELQAPAYYCLGNHEYLSGIDASMRFLRKTHLHILIDSSVMINNSIQIIGRDDMRGMRNHRRKSLDELVKNTDRTLPLLLLDHEPFHLEEAEKNGIDFQFSGHTHHGQIFPGNLMTDRMYELSHGHKQRGNTHYYVSSGLGLWGPPLRIGTQSEIVVFNIEFN